MELQYAQRYDLPDLVAKRVTVMGLGLFGGGVSATRFLVRHGARVTVTDLRPPELLIESLSALAGLPVEFVLGKHRHEDFSNTDMVLVNPAIPEDSPYLATAAKGGIPIETETNLFFKVCPCPIIGITGSQGKTTTTSLIGDILKTSGITTWTGGNIGRPLIEELQTIQPDHVAVVELSSFQLPALGSIRMAPGIAVLTNIYPNHLDRHGTMHAYVSAKKNIVSHQGRDSTAVLNYDDAELKKWLPDVRGRPLFYSRSGPQSGAYLSRDTLFTGDHIEIMPRKEIPLMGDFNVSNVLAAAAAALSLGIPPHVIRDAVRNFHPVQHRLQFLREVNGVLFYDDSVATTPTATASALGAFDRRVILIAGGYDKKLPLDQLLDEILLRVRVLILYGASSEEVAGAVNARNSSSLAVVQARSLESAIRSARDAARPGDIVLFSPAFASYDMFRNFTDRARIYHDIVASF